MAGAGARAYNGGPGASVSQDVQSRTAHIFIYCYLA